MQVIIEVGVTLEAGRDHTCPFALQALAEASLALIAWQFVTCRIEINLLRMITFSFFEQLPDQYYQSEDQEDLRDNGAR